MYDFDEEQRVRLERETIDFTIKVPVRDVIDLAAEEAFRRDGECFVRDLGLVDVWSYLGPAAALNALKDHGWIFDRRHLGRDWIEAALLQSDDYDRLERPVIQSIYEARKKITERDETEAMVEAA